MYIHIFYTNVLRIMDDHGLNKQELADRAGVSISYLSDLTNGKANPSLEIMQRIAEALDTPLPLLLESSDLTPEQLAEAHGERMVRRSSLPPGYVWVTAMLPELQAYQVGKWHEAARKRLGR